MSNNNWKEFIGENIELRDHSEKYFNLFTKFLS